MLVQTKKFLYNERHKDDTSPKQTTTRKETQMKTRMTREEKDLIDKINAIPDDKFASVMRDIDRYLARTEPYAIKDFTGHWPTKADK